MSIQGITAEEMQARENRARGLLEQGLQTLGLNRPQAVDDLMRFCALLLAQNKVMNLTGAKEASEVVRNHFLDCAAASVLLKAEGKDIIDVGCGAGFPGIPLAILYPTAQLTLLDAQGKRITFLQECVDTLSIYNAQPVHHRAEEFGRREVYEIAISRAVANLRVLCELAMPMVRVGGIFAAMKSTACDEELKESANAIDILGGRILDVHEYTIPLSVVRQRIILIEKCAPTPEKYPRRFARISASPL